MYSTTEKMVNTQSNCGSSYGWVVLNADYHARSSLATYHYTGADPEQNLLRAKNICCRRNTAGLGACPSGTLLKSGHQRLNLSHILSSCARKITENGTYANNRCARVCHTCIVISGYVISILSIKSLLSHVQTESLREAT